MKEYSRGTLLKAFRDQAAEFTLYDRKRTPEELDQFIKTLDNSTRFCTLCGEPAEGIGLFEVFQDRSEEFGGIKGKKRIMYYGACEEHFKNNLQEIEDLLQAGGMAQKRKKENML